MAVFGIIIVVLAALIGLYAYWLIRRIFVFYRLKPTKWPVKMVNILLAMLVAAACVNMWSVTAVIVLHVLAISLVLDVAAFVVRRIVRKRAPGRAYGVIRKIYRCGIVQVFILAFVLIYGFMNMGHVVRTEYTVETDKDVQPYKVVLITDIHYDTIQDTSILKDKIQEINGQNPDIVILGGDIVEEQTSREKMQELFGVLGGLETTYGTYYVYGNHDRQPYTDRPTFTDEELSTAITENGITILQDSYVEIGDDLVLAGREDAAWGNVSGRASTQEVLQGADRGKYIIVADHQPVGAEENSDQGVDLEVSGHTHAGQIWPVGIFSELAGVLNYGEYQRGDCTVIVSSGFAGWGYSIRTEGHCEYVIINIEETR